MEVSTVTTDRWEVAVSGEVDADNCAELKSEILAMESTGDALFVDLSQLTFLDSSGISVLLQIKSELEARGSSLRLHSPTDSVHRVLEITGLIEAFGLPKKAAT